MKYVAEKLINNHLFIYNYKITLSSVWQPICQFFMASGSASIRFLFVFQVIVYKST